MSQRAKCLGQRSFSYCSEADLWTSKMVGETSGYTAATTQYVDQISPRRPPSATFTPLNVSAMKYSAVCD